MAFSIQDDIVNLLIEVKSYLYRRQELYGNDIYSGFQPGLWSLTFNEQKSYQLNRLYLEIKDCRKCELADQRTKIVFGTGNPNTQIMLIGEAPGFHEDHEGKPFVGKAGQLLDKILAAIQLRRDDIFITNVVKCRPPDNRDPKVEECEACNFILKRQIEIIQPRFILLLGRIAAHVVLASEESITALRGRVHEAYGARVMVTYHPAALLRNPDLKRGTWQDVQLFQQLNQ